MAGVLDILAGAVPEVEIRSALTPPIRVATADATGSSPSPLVRWLKPSVVAYSGTGVQVFAAAPAGEASSAERAAKVGLVALVVVGLLVGIFLAGRASA